jgi:hypothetical protein
MESIMKEKSYLVNMLYLFLKYLHVNTLGVFFQMAFNP